MQGLIDLRMSQVSSLRAPADEVLGLPRLYSSGFLGWNVKHFLMAGIYRPDAAGKSQALLTMSPYKRSEQDEEMVPQGFPGNQFNRGMLEVGDFNS